jgi:hypothetical protein
MVVVAVLVRGDHEVNELKPAPFSLPRGGARR